MSDHLNVGKMAADLTEGRKYPAVTGVTLWYDDENAFTAGNSTGYVMEIDCPWATQAMANAILSDLQGFAYQPFDAESTSLNPAAELGDAISIDNIDSVIGAYSVDAYGFSNVSAADGGEEEHEYSYTGAMSKKLARKVALGESYYGTKITRAEGLTIEKTNGEDVIAKVVLNADELSFYQGSAKVLFFDPATNTYLFAGQLNVNDNFVVDASGNVTISGNLALPVGSISFTELNDEVSDAIGEASKAASDASEKVGAWAYAGTTYIDGRKIMAGTVRAGILEGGAISLLDAGERSAGTINLSAAQSAAYAVDIESGAAMRLLADGVIYLSNATSGTHITLGTSIAVNTNINPSSNSTHDLGSSDHRWRGIWLSSSGYVTSDRNLKKEIEAMSNKYDTFFDELQPVRYKFVDGTSDRYHMGLIAQDVEDAIDYAGLSTQEVAAFVVDSSNEDEIYALRYEEFIALCIDQTQKLKQRASDLEARIEALERLVNANGG